MQNGKMRTAASLVAALVAQGAAASRCCTTAPISRDVAIIGGGASGAHAAVWLRDQGHSVVVVEKASQLGGHTAFYNDPATGKVLNIGVQGWMEYADSYDFPHRMNVSTDGGMEFTTLDYKYVNFKTGLPVEGYVAPAAADLYPALQAYLDVIEQYEDMTLPGLLNFPEPGSIPEDLMLPFGEFVEKYGIEASVPQMWDATAMGLGDTMEVPTLYLIQASGIPMVRALLGLGAAAVPPSGRLWDLYEAVQTFLGDDVLYSSTVLSATRDDRGVSLKVQSANNTLTCINAKRLLIAFEPTTENMQPFHPDETETEVFDKFGYTTVYAGVLRHPSLEIGAGYSDRLPGAASLNYTDFPTPSQLGSMNYIGGTDDLFQFTAVGTEDDTPESMKALIADVIDTMIAAGTLPASDGTVTFPAFANHGKMHSRVTSEDLRSGFVTKQNALQGRHSTWFTGAAFSAGFSTVLWEYNKVLLPSVIEGL